MYQKPAKLRLVPFLLTVLIITSCQREIDFNDPDPAWGNVRESTVLQKITIKYGDGSITTRNYVKTMLSSGNYQLTWDETDPALPPDDRLLRRAVFNASGKNIINVVEHSYVATISAAGDTIFSNHITSDTLFYDASGSVSKIIT